MKELLITRITEALDLVDAAGEKADAYAFLPEIKASLVAMLPALKMTRKEREGFSGDLGRLVTEDFAFSESELGTLLLSLADDFASSE